MVEMDTLAHPRPRCRHKKSPVCVGEKDGAGAATCCRCVARLCRGVVAVDPAEAVPKARRSPLA